MATWNGTIIAAVSIFAVLVILFAIMYFMAYYTVSDIINSFMSTNSNYGFGANLIANAKKSIVFSLWYTLYTLGIYVIGFTISIALGLIIGRSHATIGLFVMYLLAVATLALRRALTPFWMPAMVSKGLGIKDAFYKNMEQMKGRFWKTFGVYYVLYLLAAVIFLVSTIFTFGVASIFVFGLIWLYFQIRDMVSFYYINGMKYYVDEQTVVDPTKKYRDAVLDDENFKL